MIIWGWGKITKKFIGSAFYRTCNHCNTTQSWQLCIIRTWFTLFFIPIIPYKKRYCVTCPNCGSYIELTAQQFEEMKSSIMNGSSNANSFAMEDSMKYQGKTEAQINYLKQMEEFNRK